MLNSSKTWLFGFVLLVAGGWYYFFYTPAIIVVNAPPRPGPIVALGDSLTAGEGAAPGQAYPDQLARMIGRPVINCGQSGNTVAEAAQRLDPDVLPQHPAVAIVLLGGNDLLRQLDLNQSFATLATIVRRLQDQGAMVVLVGLKTTPWGGVGARYEALARASGCVYIPNILGGVMLHSRLMADQIHPNGDGYRLVAQRVAAALKPYLKP